MISTNAKAVNGNLLKIAVIPYRELEPPPKKDIPQWVLYSYDPKQDLDSIIANLRASFHLESTNEEFSLILIDKSSSHFPRYITEENRNEIVNGAVVHLYYSPKQFVARIMDKIKHLTELNESHLEVLLDILNHSLDSEFVLAMEKQNGIKWLMNCLQNKEFSTDDEIAHGLEIFQKAMEHDIIHWSSIDKQFIEAVAQNIYNRTDNNLSKDVERKILINSLTILESSVINCPGKFIHEMEKQISLPNLNKLLKNDRYPEVQQNVLALINAILYRTDLSKKRAMAATLSSRPFKETILQYIINRKNSENEKPNVCGSEITHQLYVLQTLLLQFYEDKLNNGSTMDEAREKVIDIRNIYLMTMERDGFDTKGVQSQTSLFRSQTSIASNSSGSSIASEKTYVEDFERLGFPNFTHPWKTFSEAPGALVLDLLHYFAKFHTDSFVRFVIENSSIGDRMHDCPLVLASFRLTNLLCDLLGQRVKDKFWYCRLSNNHKTLLHGDCEEDAKNIENLLVNKLNISDIEQVVTGKECPHMRDARGKKTTTSLAFSVLVREDSNHLNFVASTPEIYDYWIDGLNALLERKMISNEAEKDTDMLLELDVKLRLLDMEGLSIPEKMPELPPSPTDYEFSYNTIFPY
ncbi:hypothetical protein RDWZM_001579 [Blomia tropicalis]|uniref:VHS domain-containing protein n=1 Tax=Blomia tropicalis TaxID=40697 RepID=A0A9Q0MC70_BLOTA|nr:hypothetical protein RDWZM_001579 [Blomia tropicalis]